MALRALFSLLFASALLAQEPERVPCKNCGSEGSLPCTKHGKLLLEKEKAVVFCSVAAECKNCSGALAVDCKICRNPPVEAELERRKQLAQELLAAHKKDVAELSRNDLLHLKTAHLSLTFSIRPLTVGKEKLDTHQLMHLYGERIEGLRKQFLELFEQNDKAQKAELKIYMFRDQQDQSLIGPRVTGMGGGNATGTKTMGLVAVYSMWQDQRSMPDDEGLYRNIIHNVTHLLLSNLEPEQWLGNRKAGWVDEGLAHWFEDKLTGKCMNFCYEEVALQPGTTFKGGHWRAPVRRIVDLGKVKSFAELSTLNTDQLNFEDHALSFAYVDFLLTVHGGKKFCDMVRLLKKDKPTREALQEVYGINPLMIDTQFQQWVKDNYSPQEQR